MLNQHLFYRSRHWPSNNAIANVAHRDLDLYFQGHTISGKHLISGKRLNASEKCSNMTFIEVVISHRISILRMLYIVTVTYIFKGAKFLELYIRYLESGEIYRKIFKVNFYKGRYLPSNGVSPVFLPHYLDLNFQGQKFKIIISRKR